MDNINYDLSALTPGERLWLWRRRQASPSGRRTGRGGGWMSANEAAAVLAVAVGEYCRAEADDGALDVQADLEPSAGDLCLVARRRAADRLEELCRELGVSKPYFHRLEREGHPDVIDLWRRRGFTFPEES